MNKSKVVLPRASAPRGRPANTFASPVQFQSAGTRPKPAFIGDGSQPVVKKKSGLIQPGNDQPVAPRPSPSVRPGEGRATPPSSNEFAVNNPPKGDSV